MSAPSSAWDELRRLNAGLGELNACTFDAPRWDEASRRAVADELDAVAGRAYEVAEAVWPTGMWAADG